MDIVEVLRAGVQPGCSDIHLVIGQPPMMRRNGAIMPVHPSLPVLSAEATKNMVYSILREEQIGLTEAMQEIADLPRGLALVTGPSGSGKSTALACLIELANTRRAQHILAIEDPIEFVYEPKRCIIRQREVGQNTKCQPAGKIVKNRW